MIYTASIFSPLYIVFGWVIRNLYQITNNYGLVIIIFTVGIRLLMIPLSVKQHKNTLKMQALAPQIEDLKRIYGKDRMGLSEATMALHKKHNISQFSGFLTGILPILFIWPIYRIISKPMYYLSGISAENLDKLVTRFHELKLITESEFSNLDVSDIPILRVLHENHGEVVNAVHNHWMKAENLIDLNFLNINLGDFASINPSKLFGPEMSRYLPLLGLVILATITTFLMSKLMEITNPYHKKIAESKERAKNNPARSEVSDVTQQGMMKGMKYTMPLITFVMSMTLPIAMPLYWITGNIMAMLQQYILYILYTKKLVKNKESK